jgi:DNA polymerase III alpha subunit (gram-positive type)
VPFGIICRYGIYLNLYNIYIYAYSCSKGRKEIKMTIIDAIKEKNILNSDNDIRIDEAVLKKNSKKLNISFVLTYAIDYDTYMSLKKIVEDIFHPLGLSLDFSFGYEDETLTEDELKGYLAHILEELYKKDSNFKSLQLSDSIVTGNEIEFSVAYDALGVEELCPVVEEGFAEYGLNVKVSAKKDEEKSIQAQIEALDSEIEETLSKQRQEAMQAKKFNKEVQEQKKYRRTSIPDNYTPIKAIPVSQSGLQEYLHTKGEAIFRIKGYVFALEVKDLAKSSLRRNTPPFLR